MPEGRLGVGIVGCGEISVAHHRAYTALPDHVELVALSDVVEATARRRAQEFGVELAELRGSSRRRPVACARHVAMYLAQELTAHTPAEIGKVFGERDRTTVNHAVKQIDAAVRDDEVVRASVNNLRRRLAHPAS